jgi:hypothetical protein
LDYKNLMGEIVTPTQKFVSEHLKEAVQTRLAKYRRPIDLNLPQPNYDDHKV